MACVGGGGRGRGRGVWQCVCDRERRRWHASETACPGPWTCLPPHCPCRPLNAPPRPGPPLPLWAGDCECAQARLFYQHDEPVRGCHRGRPDAPLLLTQARRRLLRRLGCARVPLCCREAAWPPSSPACPPAWPPPSPACLPACQPIPSPSTSPPVLLCSLPPCSCPGGEGSWGGRGLHPLCRRPHL